MCIHYLLASFRLLHYFFFHYLENDIIFKARVIFQCRKQSHNSQALGILALRPHVRAASSCVSHLHTQSFPLPNSKRGPAQAGECN